MIGKKLGTFPGFLSLPVTYAGKNGEFPSFFQKKFLFMRTMDYLPHLPW
jgi:hypothetical protein